MIVHTAQTALSPKGQEVSAGVTQAPGGVSPIDLGVPPGNLSLLENVCKRWFVLFVFYILSGDLGFSPSLSLG